MNENKSLTVVEHDRLFALEEVIERGMDTFATVGAALLAIRDEHLYRQDYLSFAAYVEDRWHITRQRAYQLITAGLMSTRVDIQNEAQSRQLNRLPEDEQPLAWSIAEDLSAKIAPDKPIPVRILKAVVNVLDTAKKTKGYVDTGDGTMDAIEAAVTVDTYETAKRQQQHIRESLERQEGNGDRPRFTGEFTVYHVSQDKHLLVLIVQPDLLQAVGQGEKGNYVIYLTGKEGQPSDQ